VNLKIFYEKGDVIPQSNNEAAKRYQKAAEKGVPEAKYRKLSLILDV
jgi:TPR repeat protein